MGLRRATFVLAPAPPGPTPRAAAAQRTPSSVARRAEPAAKARRPRRGRRPRPRGAIPDLSGVYTNNDESLIPFERPGAVRGPAARGHHRGRAREAARRSQRAAHRGRPQPRRVPKPDPLVRESFSEQQPRVARHRSAGRPGAAADRRGARSVPRRAPLRRRGRARPIPAEDRSLYDRCITRGMPGSMMPAIYGNAYEILQGPGYVAIRYEMVHEARVIPLDGRPHAGQNIRMYMGDARGRWDGNTLVVETTNFTDKTPYRGSSEHLKLTERFTRSGRTRSSGPRRSTIAHTWTRAVDVRDEPVEEGRQPASVRIRVPRGQLRHGGHPQRRPRRGAPAERQKGVIRAAGSATGSVGIDEAGRAPRNGVENSAVRARTSPLGRPWVGAALAPERRGCRDGAPPLPRARCGGEQAVLDVARRDTGHH